MQDFTRNLHCQGDNPNPEGSGEKNNEAVVVSSWNILILERFNQGGYILYDSYSK